ncbi:response regulator [Bacillus sp. AK128]
MIKVVLADDQDLIRGSLRIVLQSESDIEVVGMAANGAEAIDLCKQFQPHIVLMDIHMPEVNGIEATKQIKEQWPTIKVVMLTTFHEMNYVREAMKAGAEGYLLKAMQPEDLASSIRLVYKGGTLIPQEIAKMMVAEWTGDLSSNAPVQNAIEIKPRYGMTNREMEVLRLIVAGSDNRQIASKLYLSEGTVKNYISSIYSKLGVTDRIQAILKTQEERLLEVDL